MKKWMTIAYGLLFCLTFGMRHDVRANRRDSAGDRRSDLALRPARRWGLRRWA